MRMQGSAGRRDFLTDEFCIKLTLTADHPNPESKKLECEFLGRLLTELKNGNIGYWLGKLRKA